MPILDRILDRLFPEKSKPVKENDFKLILEEALHNAMLIIVTAAENGIPLEQNDVHAVMLANEQSKSELPGIEVQRDFWISYERITQAIHPITINSIKANLDPNINHSSSAFRFFRKKNIPLSRRCASNYKLISLITLVLLISIQIYWYIGWSITTDIDAQEKQIVDLHHEVGQMILPPIQGHPATPNTARSEMTIKQVKLRRQIEEHNNWKDAASYHLENWNHVWSSMDLLTLQTWQNSDYETFPVEVQRRLQYIAAGNMLQAITAYILPILYGLIGACFYILRQLPKEIESLTFSMNSYIDYSLRMAQGPLAGILTSYFFVASQDSPVQNQSMRTNPSEIHGLSPELSALSPLAMAFIAGYSVEFIFSFIDKMLDSSVPDQTVIAANRERKRGTKAHPESPSKITKE